MRPYLFFSAAAKLPASPAPLQSELHGRKRRSITITITLDSDSRKILLCPGLIVATEGWRWNVPCPANLPVVVRKTRFSGACLTRAEPFYPYSSSRTRELDVRHLLIFCSIYPGSHGRGSVPKATSAQKPQHNLEAGGKCHHNRS
jgi:hypothetical protein